MKLFNVQVHVYSQAELAWVKREKFIPVGNILSIHQIDYKDDVHLPTSKWKIFTEIKYNNGNNNSPASCITKEDIASVVGRYNNLMNDVNIKSEFVPSNKQPSPDYPYCCVILKQDASSSWNILDHLFEDREKAEMRCDYLRKKGWTAIVGYIALSQEQYDEAVTKTVEE